MSSKKEYLTKNNFMCFEKIENENDEINGIEDDKEKYLINIDKLSLK